MSNVNVDFLAKTEAQATPVLNLAALPELFPTHCFLNLYGPSTIVRLSRCPTSLPQGTTQRRVIVEWRPRDRSLSTRKLSVEVVWDSVPNNVKDDVEKLSVTHPPHRITEDAAVVLAALLLQLLEELTVTSVLPIGSGGDFSVRLSTTQNTQVECSGIHSDKELRWTANCVKKKSNQVLKNSIDGFAAVTTFSYSASAEVRVTIHHVNRLDTIENEVPRRRRQIGRRK